MFSIIATLSLHGLNPREWLKWYLQGCTGCRVPPDVSDVSDVSGYRPWNLTPEQRTENRTDADADAVSANCFLKKSLPRRFTSLHINAAATRRPAFSLRSTHGCGEDLPTSSPKSSLDNNFDTRWPWRLRGDLLLKSYRRRHCFYSRVLANWAASGDVTRSVSEGERSKLLWAVAVKS